MGQIQDSDVMWITFCIILGTMVLITATPIFLLLFIPGSIIFWTPTYLNQK